MTGSKEGDLLHGTSEPSGGYTGDNLLPKEGAHLVVIRFLDRSWSLCKMKKDAHPQQNTPGPLFNVEGHGGEKQTAELNDENLEKGNMRKIGAGKKCQYSDVFLFRDVSWDAAYINDVGKELFLLRTCCI